MSPDNATYATDPAGWRQATSYYCGLEANITNPSNGVTALMYIGDVFAVPSVRSPYFPPIFTYLDSSALVPEVTTVNKADLEFVICRAHGRLM